MPTAPTPRVVTGARMKHPKRQHCHQPGLHVGTARLRQVNTHLVGRYCPRVCNVAATVLSTESCVKKHGPSLPLEGSGVCGWGREQGREHSPDGCWGARSRGGVQEGLGIIFLTPHSDPQRIVYGFF